MTLPASSCGSREEHMSFTVRILVYVIRAALAIGAIVAGFMLTHRFGPVIGMAIAAGAAAAASLVAALLLRWSPVGRVTWLNHLAGFFMPWGARFGLGALWQFAVGSGVIWGLLALIGTMLALAPAGTPDVCVWLLGAAWLVDGIGMAFVAGSIVQTRESLASRANRSMLAIVAVLLGVFAISSAALYLGTPVMAIVFAAAPIVLLGVPFGLFVIFIVTQGKNMRWH